MAAEDATSEIFMKAFTGIRGYRQERSFRSWLFAIAHNTITDSYRTHRPQEPIEAAAWLLDPEPSPEERAMLAEGQRSVEALLSRVTPQQARILELRSGRTDWSRDRRGARLQPGRGQDRPGARLRPAPRDPRGGGNAAMTEYHDALDRYLDDLADGKPVITAQLDLGLIEAIDQFAEVGRNPAPHPDFVDQLEERLMNAISNVAMVPSPPIRIGPG